MRRWVVGIVITSALILAACGDARPAKSVTQGDELFSAAFDTPGSWEEGTYPTGSNDPDSVLAIADGRYQIEHRAARSASFTWGVGGDEVENVIVEVDTDQISAEKDNLYGIGCRLAVNSSGDVTGYALLISGDGHYAIAEVSRGSLDFLVEWHQSQAIKQGQATNTIRAVCVDNYLAVYANGTFLGDVKNDDYRRAGQVGLIAGVTKDADVSVAFDNLVAHAGALKN
jgi:hypothetical protein